MPTFITVNASDLRTGEVAAVRIQVEQIAGYRPEADGAVIYALGWSWVVSEKPSEIDALIQKAQDDGTRRAYAAIREQVKS